MTPLLEVRNLTKLYDVVIGVNDMSFDLQPGVHGLLGPNGAGKSTLLKLVTGQLRPSEGSVRVLGEAPWSNPGLFRRIGFCPEYDAFYDYMTAHEFVSRLGHIGGMTKPVADSRATEVLELCGASDFLHRPISTFSKGMRQRTKVAQALVHDPEFVILDEPLNGTDPVGRHDLTEIVRRLGAEGRSVLVSSHVLHEVQAMTDQFLLIFGGRCLASGGIREIRSLIHEHPHRVVLRCSSENLRSFASRLVQELDVFGMQLDVDSGALEIATNQPTELYSQIARIALECGTSIYEMNSQDDNLEAVFKYLVGGR